MNSRSILKILTSLNSANEALQFRKLYRSSMRRIRILLSCKRASFKFLIRALERPKDATRALTQRDSDIEVYIDYTYKFKVFLVSWRLLYYIY